MFFQIRVQQGFLTRSPYLAPNFRIDGYPGYRVVYHDRRDLVRSIFYSDGPDHPIYLTTRKKFHLTSYNGSLVFTSSDEVPSILLRDYIPTDNVYLWNDIWSNQENDVSSRSGLVFPAQTWQEAWRYASNKRLIVAFKTGNNWISTNDYKDTTVGFEIGNSPAKFVLLERDGQWGLEFLGKGIPKIYEFSIGNLLNLIQGTPPGGLYIDFWPYDSNDTKYYRWVLNKVPEYFDVIQSGTSSYIFKFRGHELSFDDWWAIWGSVYVYDGLQFHGSQHTFTFDAYIMEGNLTDFDKYYLGGFFKLTNASGNPHPPYSSIGIRENMPEGSGSCRENLWDGTNPACYGEMIPYTESVGSQQCTIIDDFRNDLHCQRWAVENRGTKIDSLLRELCKDSKEGENTDVCACYYPDNVYYDKIVENHTRRGKTERGRIVADSIKATNLLQCASGLCDGREGKFSSEVYYRPPRKCDVCIQVMTANIQAEKITGDIRLEQTCTNVDPSYTWSDLLTRLKDLGVSHFQDGKVVGEFSHMIINKNENAIKFMASTDAGEEVMEKLSLMQGLGEPGEDVILRKSRWVTNVVQYTKEILLFFLQGREY